MGGPTNFNGLVSMPYTAVKTLLRWIRRNNFISFDHKAIFVRLATIVVTSPGIPFFINLLDVKNKCSLTIHPGLCRKINRPRTPQESGPIRKGTGNLPLGLPYQIESLEMAFDGRGNSVPPNPLFFRGRLPGWLAGCWLAGCCLAGWLGCWLAGWLAGCLAFKTMKATQKKLKLAEKGFLFFHHGRSTMHSLEV